MVTVQSPVFSVLEVGVQL